MFKTLGWLCDSVRLSIFTLLLIAVNSVASASYLKMATSTGGGSNTYTFSGEQTFNDSWGMYYSAGETRTSSSGETTRSLELGANYLNDKWLNVSFGAEYDRQELGEVVGTAPVATISHKWYYAASTNKNKTKFKASERKVTKKNSDLADKGLGDEQSDQDPDESESAKDFTPNFSLSLTYKQKDYSQKPPRSTGKEFKVQQNYTSLSFSLNPDEKWGVNLYYTNYDYDQDVPAFYRLVNLNATKIIRGANLTEGLASTLSGFYDHEYGFGFTYNINEDSSLDFTHSRSFAMVDSTWEISNGLSFTSNFLDNWTYNLSISTSKSEQSTSVGIYGDAYISYFF